MSKRILTFAILAIFALGTYYLYGMFMGDYYLSKAKEIEKGDNWNTAINAFNKAVEYAPGNPEYRLMFGKFYVRFAERAKDKQIKARLFKKAFHQLDRARKTSPKDARIYLALAQAAEGMLYLKSGTTRPPEYYYEKALHFDPNSRQYLYLFARFYRRAERFHEALRLIEKMIKAEPHTYRYVDRKPFWDIPDIETSVESGLRQSLNNRFTRASAAGVLASRLAREGKWAEAAVVYKNAVPESRFVDRTNFYLTMGNYLLRAGNQDQAESYFSLGVENVANKAAALKRLAQYYKNAKNQERLLALLEELKTKHPRLAEIDLCLAQTLYALKAFQAAREHLEKFLNKKETAEADYWMAMACSKLEHPYEAETYIKRAIKWEPNNPGYRHFYAGLLQKAWRFSDALKQAEAAVSASQGKNPWYLDRKAQILYSMKQYKESTRIWKQASSLKPEYQPFKRHIEKANRRILNFEF